MYTVFDVPPRKVNGVLTEIDLAEKQVIVADWNANLIIEKVAKYKSQAQHEAEAKAHELGADIAFAKLIEFLAMESNLKTVKQKKVVAIHKDLTKELAILDAIETFEDLQAYENSLNKVKK